MKQLMIKTRFDETLASWANARTRSGLCKTQNMAYAKEPGYDHKRQEHEQQSGAYWRTNVKRESLKLAAPTDLKRKPESRAEPPAL
jgi:hypothetical protein